MWRWIGGALVLLGAVLCLRAAMLESELPAASGWTPGALDESAMLERFRGGLRIPTVSLQPGQGMDEEAFIAFRAYLARHYPLVHAKLERETVSKHSLLFRWPGSDSALGGTVLLAHQDVVPVDTGSEGDWVHPPYDAVVEGGFIWGRGSLDDKFGLFSILEAVEKLLAEGFRPRRSLYLVFGHDEELGGPNGAVPIARRFAESRSPIGLVVDEGGAIAQGMVPGLDAPVALVGVAEKGYMNVVLEVEGMGHHQ